MPTSVRVSPALTIKKGDVLLIQAYNEEKKVVRIDDIRFSKDGWVLVDYSVLYPQISVGCLMSQREFSSKFSPAKHLFTLPDQEFEKFLEFVRFANNYEAMKTTCDSRDPVSEAFDGAMKKAGFKSTRVGAARRLPYRVRQ